MKLFSHWLVAALAILIAAYIVPGVSVTLVGALIAAVVLGALNLFIRPILLILTLPINILTLGLFSLVINAVLVLLASYFVPGFLVDGFLTALFSLSRSWLLIGYSILGIVIKLSFSLASSEVYKDRRERNGDNGERDRKYVMFAIRNQRTEEVTERDHP